jgi:hypothetical protein
LTRSVSSGDQAAEAIVGNAGARMPRGRGVLDRSH